MNTDQTDIELIERYLLGKLTNAEIRVFETRLGEDREFARKYRLRKTFPSLMQEPVDSEIEKKPAEMPASTSEPEYFRHFKVRHLLWVAIAVILTGIMILFAVIRSNRPVEKVTHAGSDPKMNIPKVREEKLPGKNAGSGVTGETIQKPIALKMPSDGMHFKRTEEILFSWEQKTDSMTNFYIFSEYHDKLVLWRGIKPGIREYNVAAMSFLPGRFYWYVGTSAVKRTFIIGE